MQEKWAVAAETGRPDSVGFSELGVWRVTLALPSWLCASPTAGMSPCAGMSRETGLRDCSTGAAPSLEAAVLSIIQIMGSPLKSRATRKGLVHQHFELVFHC